MENKQPYGFIYETTNSLNGMKYIGKCVYTRKNSWENYLGSGLHLQRAIKKYGKERFVRTILEDAYSEKSLRELEEDYIEKFNCVDSDKYYNLKATSIGGDTFTHNPNKEHTRKLKSRNSIGENNNQCNKEKTPKTLEAISKANSKGLIVEGIPYPNLAEASAILGLKLTTLHYRLQSPNFPKYVRIKARTNSKKGTQIQINGVIYDSFAKASDELEISASTLRNRINRGFDGYLLLNREIQNTPKKVKIDNIIYNSISEASKELNCSKVKVRQRCTHKEHFKTWEFVT